MGPSQVSIDPDQEKKSEIAGKTLVAQDGKGVRCVSNCQDTTFDMEVSSDQMPLELVAAESAGVDIVECTDTADVRMTAADDPNATEYSSSFSDSVSGKDDSKLSDAEVESRFSGDNGIDSSLFDGFDLLRMRKKKLTPHWRSYIHPQMWRCKWLELRIKQLESQALKYDKELASYNKRKKLESGTCMPDDWSMRTLPFVQQTNRKKVMKRRKRKRMEDKVDIPSYMSHHNLFSYYEHKKSDADGALVDDDFGLQVFQADSNQNDELDVKYACTSHESTDDRSSVEKVLYDIETVQSRVQNLKIQLDELVKVNAGKFSSIENLSLVVQSDLPSSSVRTPNLSPRVGDTLVAGVLPQHISEYDCRDLVMPEGAVSADRESAPPDIIESTMEMLTAADGYLNHPLKGDSCENMMDEVLINNERDEKDKNDFEKVSGMPTENKPPLLVKEEAMEIIVPPSVSQVRPNVSQEEAQVGPEQSVLKPCLTSDFMVPTNKRKRVQRKARLGVWKDGKVFRRRSLGKSDDQ